MIKTDELETEIQKYDFMFGTRSKYYPCSSIILINMPLDDWQIRITKRKNKRYCLLHGNKYGRTNKYHIQSYKGSLFACYDSIYNHKKYLHIIKGEN
jgi:hypothetical protein